VLVVESLRQADDYAADSSSLQSEEDYIILSVALDCTVRIWSCETGVLYSKFQCVICHMLSVC
jgi:hypothetical protein